MRALLQHGRTLPGFRAAANDAAACVDAGLFARGHSAHLISDAVDGFDLGAFHLRYHKGSPRNQPLHPPMMARVLVYGFATGVFSSHKITRRRQKPLSCAC